SRRGTPALLFALLLIAFPAIAATTTSINLSVNETRNLQILGVTAAWAVDTNIVDAAVTNRGVTLFGRGGGRTRVVIIGVTGENALEVIVEPKPNTANPTATAPARQTIADVRYSSATREVQNGVTMTRQEGDRRTQLDVRTIHQTANINGDRPKTSVPVVSYGIFTGKREVTFFDRDVLHSPLTLSGTALRGIHYLDDHWRVHAGYTTYAAYQSFLVPVRRELVAGAAYAFRTSARSTFTPGVFVYPGQGTIVSLLHDYRLDHSSLRTELGIGNGVGGAVQFALDTADDQARVDVRYRPQGFATIGSGEVRGLRADANWSHAYGRGSSAALAFGAADLGMRNERVLSASADVDQRLSDRISLTGGASWGSFQRAGITTDSLTVPVGVDVRFARGSVTALYRYAQSGVNSGGHGGRVGARASLGHFYVSGYVDRQQNAPTLDVIFREQPELALALSELGITATSPSDVARALRENAVLEELGFIEGITVDFAPMRTQFGFETAWLGASAARHQLRVHMLHNIVEGVSSRTATTIASLTYARRITSATDMFAGYTYWRTERRGFDAIVQPYVEVGVRQRFDGVPSFGGGSGSISGIVFADEDLDGTNDGTGVAAEVELDGSQRQQTGDDGRFTFRDVARGSHRVTARVSRPEAYFTTPSRIEAQPGDDVTFGVATTPARVTGRVTNDAGQGIAGVRVLLSRGTRQVTATTDSEGKFTAATAPGEWEISILPDSVPAGHSLAGADKRSVMLKRDEPRNVEWKLTALRSVSGHGAPANAEIAIEPLGTRVHADAAGNFSIRSLPAGDLTLIAGNAKRTVTLGSGPSLVSVNFKEERPDPVVGESIRTEAVGEKRDVLHGYVVQIGAYRVRANAEETLQRARRSGVDAQLRVSGELTIVSAGPYPSSKAATQDATRLHEAGLEAVVTSRK
ncbi:MAG: carboxypeptidase regulatory-like domain-containing protein, partial [Thermoanaerobaculia bacterium]